MPLDETPPGVGATGVSLAALARLVSPSGLWPSQHTVAQALKQPPGGRGAAAGGDIRTIAPRVRLNLKLAGAGRALRWHRIMSPCHLHYRHWHRVSVSQKWTMVSKAAARLQPSRQVALHLKLKLVVT